jgi:hypothetical protein
MRYVPIGTIISTMFSTPVGAKEKKRLFKAHKKVAKMVADSRQKYIRDNGPSKWSPVKKQLTAILGNKCWYTEAELVGAPLAIDHFRPVVDYWWLAFDAHNFRVSCPYANSPEHNKNHGCAGGKGSNFPLLGAAVRASGKNKLRQERPMILDPCNKADCDLLAFQADGRPILSPKFSTDAIAINRVNESKLLLNLDHPDFNSKREQVYLQIRDDVFIHEQPGASNSTKAKIVWRLETMLKQEAQFSTAARQYLAFHKHLQWVDDLLKC